MVVAVPEGGRPASRRGTGFIAKVGIARRHRRPLAIRHHMPAARAQPLLLPTSWFIRSGRDGQSVGAQGAAGGVGVAGARERHGFRPLVQGSVLFAVDRIVVVAVFFDRIVIGLVAAHGTADHGAIV